MCLGIRLTSQGVKATKGRLVLGRAGIVVGLHLGDADLCCMGDNGGVLHMDDAGSMRKGDAHSYRM